METLGVWLRQTREARDETLKEIEAATRIRARYLEMLEAGEFGTLPGGEVQVRGFLRIYSRHLDLSPDEVLARYEAEMRDASIVRRDAATPPSSVGLVSEPGSRWARPETLMVAGIVLIGLLGATVGGWYLIGTGDGEDESAATTPTASIAAAVPRTEVVTEVAPPAALPTFPVDPEGTVTVAVEATEHVWVRVTTDGAVAFEGLLAPGQVESWSGKEAVIVDSGNGAGLLVSANGQPQGVLGERGKLSARAWGPTGEIDVPAIEPETD